MRRSSFHVLCRVPDSTTMFSSAQKKNEMKEKKLLQYMGRNRQQVGRQENFYIESFNTRLHTHREKKIEKPIVVFCLFLYITFHFIFLLSSASLCAGVVVVVGSMHQSHLVHFLYNSDRPDSITHTHPYTAHTYTTTYSHFFPNSSVVQLSDKKPPPSSSTSSNKKIYISQQK